LIIHSLPQRAQVTFRNHDGKALRGCANALAGEGRGSVPSGRQTCEGGLSGGVEGKLIIQAKY
jgi:hypothetical protein